MTAPESTGSTTTDADAVDPEELADGSTPDADLQVENAATPRDSSSREEPPRETSAATGLVSPGSTATGAGATT